MDVCNEVNHVRHAGRLYPAVRDDMTALLNFVVEPMQAACGKR